MSIDNAAAAELAESPVVATSSAAASRRPDPTAFPIEPERLYCLSVEQYEAMGRAGVFAEAAAVELLAGILVAKMNKNPPHAATKRALAREIRGLLTAEWDLLIEDPIRLPRSVPEPDLTVARRDPNDYAQRHPLPAEVALVVEVAESSLAQDRGIKRRVYAEAALPEYWVVNLVDRRVEVYTQPTGPDASPEYRSRRDYLVADEIPLTVAGSVLGTIAVRSFVRDEGTS